MGVNSYPWLPREAVLFMAHFLKQKPCTVLEFGCGGSTVWLHSRVKRLVSVEHNEGYVNLVKTKCTGNLEIILEPTPYDHVCDRFDDETFDFILVDGRNRVKCFEKSLRLLKKGGVIMLDNSEREYYSKVFDFVNNWEQRHATGPDLNNTFDYEVWKCTWWKKEVND